MMTKISSSSFYNEYHGHKVQHLQTLYPQLRSNSDALIFTAGDSSLDNKYWFNDKASAVGVYKDVLQPPTMICDVTYHLNSLLEDDNRYNKGMPSISSNNNNTRRIKYAAINSAVEATTLNERSYNLRPQDRFIRDNISSDDVLIVSVGGNDIALCPTPCTIASVAGLLCLPTRCLESGRSYGSVPMNDYCCGCGPSSLSCTCSCPPCLGYFRHLFGTRTQKYIETLTAKTKPKKILVCLIYYPDENNTPSWANGALGALGYNRNPAKIQLILRKIFEEATSTIQIHGSEVIPIPLFRALDGTRSEDYVARVEPSASGGRKMAEYMLDVIYNGTRTTYSDVSGLGMGISAPTTSFIDGRAT